MQTRRAHRNNENSLRRQGHATFAIKSWPLFACLLRWRVPMLLILYNILAGIEDCRLFVAESYIWRRAPRATKMDKARFGGARENIWLRFLSHANVRRYKPYDIFDRFIALGLGAG